MLRRCGHAAHVNVVGVASSLIVWAAPPIGQLLGPRSGADPDPNHLLAPEDTTSSSANASSAAIPSSALPRTVGSAQRTSTRCMAYAALAKHNRESGSTATPFLEGHEGGAVVSQ